MTRRRSEDPENWERYYGLDNAPKRCPDCKSILPIEAFYRNGKGALSGYCKPCTKARASEQYQNFSPEEKSRRVMNRRSYKPNRERVNRYTRERRKRDPEFRDRLNAGNRDYRARREQRRSPKVRTLEEIQAREDEAFQDWN